MDSRIVMTLIFVVMMTVTPVPTSQARVKTSSMDVVRTDGPIPLVMSPGTTGDDRMDMQISRQMNLGGGGGHGSFPMPLPGFGSIFGHRQLPFEAISGPYVSSSIGPVFSSGPMNGLGIPFSPGPLGGIMGIPLAMIAMG